MPVLFFVNCERTVLFSVKRDLDPHFTTLLFRCERKAHQKLERRRNDMHKCLRDPWGVLPYMGYLIKEWTMSSVRPSNSGCTGIVGRARR